MHSKSHGAVTTLILQSSQYLFLHIKFVILMGGKGVLFLLWQSQS